MVKVFFGQVWPCGVLWSPVLSSLARQGLSWLGIVRPCPVRYRDVWLGFIMVLRGLALYSTVLSCPVRSVKARCGRPFRGMVSRGGAGSCPAGSGGVWLGKVRRFLVRSGSVGRGTVERGFVWLGKALWLAWWRGCLVRLAEVIFRRGIVESGFARLRAVGQALVLLWFGGVQGMVRLGVSGFHGYGSMKNE